MFNVGGGGGLCVCVQCVGTLLCLCVQCTLCLCLMYPVFVFNVLCVCVQCVETLYLCSMCGWGLCNHYREEDIYILIIHFIQLVLVRLRVQKVLDIAFLDSVLL